VWRTPPGPLVPPDITARPPAAELANYHFNREWYAAIRRELRRECASAEEARAAWEQIALTVIEAFQNLVSPDYWMQCLLATDDPAALLTAAEWERAEVHLNEAFRLMLAPWFKGRAELPRENLAEVVTLLEKRTRNLKENSDDTATK
jgi:hypothetical protein